MFSLTYTLKPRVSSASEVHIRNIITLQGIVEELIPRNPKYSPSVELLLNLAHAYKTPAYKPNTCSSPFPFWGQNGRYKHRTLSANIEPDLIVMVTELLPSKGIQKHSCAFLKYSCMLVYD